MVSLLSIILLSYLVGSIPTSIIVSKLRLGKDIRTFGSGNAGATNTFRVMGWKSGLIVAIVDIAKGAFAALVISNLRIGSVPMPLGIGDGSIQLIAGAAAVLGHIWTIFAGFHGGKGVATGIGMILGTIPGGLLVGIPAFLILVFVTGYVSLSSIVATAIIPLSLIFVDETGILEIPAYTIWFMIGLSLLIFYTHRANIKRLVAGTESSFKKK